MQIRVEANDSEDLGNVTEGMAEDGWTCQLVKTRACLIASVSRCPNANRSRARRTQEVTTNRFACAHINLNEKIIASARPSIISFQQFTLFEIRINQLSLFIVVGALNLC